MDDSATLEALHNAQDEVVCTVIYCLTLYEYYVLWRTELHDCTLERKSPLVQNAHMYSLLIFVTANCCCSYRHW